MLRRLILAAGAAALAVPTPARAQDAASRAPAGPARAEVAPIATDRPDFIESSVVVPAGSWQLENGLLFARAGARDVARGTESLLRASINDRWEWRLGLPNVEFERGPGALGAGHGDAYAGLKFQVGPWRDWDIALIPGTTVPVGGAGRTSGAFDPELKVTAARELPADFDLAAMLAVAAPTEDGVRTTTFQPAFSIGRTVAPGWRLFLEWVGAWERNRETGHLAHAGIAWQLSPDVQLDAHAGQRMAGDFPDRFVAVGLSLRRRAAQPTTP